MLVEICNKNKKHVIIYRHSSMDLNEFNDENISTEVISYIL